MGGTINMEACDCCVECPLCDSVPLVWRADFGGYIEDPSNPCCQCFFDNSPYFVPVSYIDSWLCVWKLFLDDEAAEDNQIEIRFEYNIVWDRWDLTVKCFTGCGCWNICGEGCPEGCFHPAYCEGVSSTWEKSILAAHVPINCNPLTDAGSTGTGSLDLGWTQTSANRPTEGQPDQCDCTTMTFELSF